MSKFYGFRVMKSSGITKEDVWNFKIDVAMKYIKGRKRKNSDSGLFVFRVPDLYEIIKLGRTKNIDINEVEIKEKDLMRMIRADKPDDDDETWIERKVEQLDLDDDTFLSICLVQSCYYLSRASVVECKRMARRQGYPQWLELKERRKRGGRIPGKCYNVEMSLEDKARIESMIKDYDRLVRNMVRGGRLEEYIELHHDIAMYEGKKFSRKECIHTYFTLRTQK